MTRLSFIFTALLAVSFSSFVVAHHKPDHKPGYGYCYSGEGTNSSKPQCPITIARVSDLRFPSVVSGFSQVITIDPNDAGAAVFKISGVPCSRISVQVIDTVAYMLANGSSTSDTIEVRDFTYGGSLSESGGAYTDCSTGELSNVRVGGTAHVRSSNTESVYEGSPTLEALYY